MSAVRRAQLAWLACLLILAFLLSLWPGHSPASLVEALIFIGRGESAAFSPLFGYAQHFGAPAGAPVAWGLPYVLTEAALICIFGLAPLAAYIAAGWLFLLVTWAGAALLFRRIGIPPLLAVAGAFLFFLQPTVHGMAIYGPYVFGMAALPLYALVDLTLLARIGRQGVALPRRAALVALYTALKTVAMFMDGYSFVMWTALSLTFVAVWAVQGILDRAAKAVLLRAAAFAIATIAATVLYNLYFSEDAAFAVMTADFFRAQGVDLLTLLIPQTGYSWVADVFGWSRAYVAAEWFGDGMNVYLNYFGFVLAALLVAGLVLLISRSRISGLRPVIFHPAAPIVLAGAAAFFVSLGPSIKIGDMREQPVDGPFRYSYLMPREAATLTVPGLDAVYTKTPGLKNMRAVVRWQVLARLGLVMGGILTLAAIGRRRPALAALLAAAAIVEYIPSPAFLRNWGQDWGGQLMAFQREVSDAVRPEIPAGSLTFILGDGDFLANPICARARLRCYNVAGDKNNAFAAPHWPAELAGVRARQLDANDALYALAQRGELDAVLISYFRLGEDPREWPSYYWPPSPEDREARRAAMAERFDMADPRFRVTEHEWFAVAEPVL